jgi:hypothetical protein
MWKKHFRYNLLLQYNVHELFLLWVEMWNIYPCTNIHLPYNKVVESLDLIFGHLYLWLQMNCLFWIKNIYNNFLKTTKSTLVVVAMNNIYFCSSFEKWKLTSSSLQIACNCNPLNNFHTILIYMLFNFI